MFDFAEQLRVPELSNTAESGIVVEVKKCGAGGMPRDGELWWAAKRGDLEEVKRLVAARADIEETDEATGVSDGALQRGFVWCVVGHGPGPESWS